MKEHFMKKFFASLVILLSMICAQSAYSAIVTPMAEGEFQEYINKIGFKILNKNEIENRVVFRYSNSEKMHSHSTEDMVVYIPKGIIMNIETEDELAAVIAFQTAYCLKNGVSKNAKALSSLSPQKYEELADKRAVDMLVKSDYSPLASIVIINKSFGENKNSRLHQKTSVRLANIYEYILRKYPEKINSSKFVTNIYYQNFLLTSRKNREILQERLLNAPDSTRKMEYK